MGNSEYIRVSVASGKKYLNKSTRTVARMCKEGTFLSARKTGRGNNTPWEVLRSEVLAHIVNGHSDPFS